MNNKFIADGTLTLERKSPSSFTFTSPFSHIGKVIQAQLDTLDAVYRFLTNIVQNILLVILALWIVFLGVGLLICIFGANLEQQKYALAKNIPSNDFIKLACQTKTICNVYKQAKLNCALEANATVCLFSKMRGADYSECSQDGGVRGVNDKIIPDEAQCIGSKFASLVN